MASLDELVIALDGALVPMGFVVADHPEAVEGIEWPKLWTRKTWNTNRAVALLRLPPDGRGAGPLSQAIKIPLGKATKYIPFLYPLGLQVVWFGSLADRAPHELEPFVDKIDNQRCLVQSIHVIDLDAKLTGSARTWGQVVTGKYQDAIEAALRSVLAR